jgi:hypothetical protein
MNFSYEDGKILFDYAGRDQEIGLQAARSLRTQLATAIRKYEHNVAEFFNIRRSTYKTHLAHKSKVEEGVTLCGDKFEETQVHIDPVRHAIENWNMCKKCEKVYDQRS